MEWRMLGGLEVSQDGRSVDLGSPKLRLLLAVPLCRLNQAVPVPDLVDAVWPDDPPDSAVANLRSYVDKLRRTVGPDVIVRHCTRYRLVWRSNGSTRPASPRASGERRPG